MESPLEGVLMEVKDMLYKSDEPSTAEEAPTVVVTTNVLDAFANCEVAILVGAMPRRAGMERRDLLKANAAIFRAQGEALAAVASPAVKVLVVGNPANTNALVLSRYAPSIPPENITALTRLDENRAAAMLTGKLVADHNGGGGDGRRQAGTAASLVRNVIMWGNHSSTQFPDIAHCHIEGLSGAVDARAIVGNDWYEHTYVPAIQTRGAAVIAARKASAAMSAAKAIADHLYSWLNGTPPGTHTSMAVSTTCGAAEAARTDYGVPAGLWFSLPVTCHNGSWMLVEGLGIDAYAERMIAATAGELTEERDEAIAILEGLDAASA